MKKTLKLIILLVVLIGLVAGYVILINYQKNQDADDTEETEDTTIEVLSIDSDSIITIDYEYEEESISMVKNDGVWHWTLDADYPIDQTCPEYLINDISYITATRLIAENLDNEADFGMDEPLCAIKYTTNGGNEYVYTIGAYNSATEGYYFKVSTQDKIYLTDNSAAENIAPSMLDMIEVDTLPTVGSDSIKTAEYILEGKKYILTKDSEGVDFYADPYTYFFVREDGVKVAADGQAAAELMLAFAGTYLGNPVKFKPTADELQSYGLGDVKTLVMKLVYEEDVADDDSDTSINVKTEKDYSMNIGKYIAEDNTVTYYATVDGSNILYEVSGGEDLFKALSAEMESKLVCPVDDEDAVSIKVEIGDKQYFYNIADIQNDEKLTGIYNSITSIVNEGNTNGQKGDVVMKITFDLSDKEMALTIYKYDEKNYIASFDKWDNLLVSVEKIDNIIADLQS